MLEFEGVDRASYVELEDRRVMDETINGSQVIARSGPAVLDDRSALARRASWGMVASIAEKRNEV
ncbi:MAG: hypothetical protein AB7O54_01610 [Pseudomonadales bacterium]